VRFESVQSSSVMEMHLTSRDGSLTADIVYYVRLTDVLLSNADVIGCPASIGIDLCILSFSLILLVVWPSFSMFNFTASEVTTDGEIEMCMYIIDVEQCLVAPNRLKL